MENLSGFLDDYKFDRTSKVDTMRIIIEVLNESVRDIQKKRMDTFIEKVVKKNKEVISDETPELIHDAAERHRKVPVMAHLDIPLIPDVLNLLLREMVQLSNMFPDKNIMQYTSWGGKVTNVIQIPVCSNKTSFIRMNQSKRFLDKLPQYI